MATINGTNSADSLYGTAAADIINGLNGNDTLKGFGLLGSDVQLLVCLLSYRSSL
jgi:Ca2+-binding RTX toxin-like protein